MHVRYLGPYDNRYALDFNRYYLLGLKQAGVLDTRDWLKFQAASLIYRHEPPTPDAKLFVGRYRATIPGVRSLNVAIDAHDSPRIADESALKWSDLYFKSNKWRTETYPAHVLPLVNGNGLHSATTLGELKLLRTIKKTTDVCFVSRLAGDIEENLRIWETLAGMSLRTRPKLGAVLYKRYGQDRYAQRLQAYGVEVFYEFIPKRTLWLWMAQSRVNVIRLGIKGCLPWRMIDALAMGANIVLNKPPNSDWPIRLSNRYHYYSGDGIANDVTMALDYPLCDAASYFDAWANPGATAMTIQGRVFSTIPRTEPYAPLSPSIAAW